VLIGSVARTEGLGEEDLTANRCPAGVFDMLISVNWFGDFVALYGGGYACHKLVIW
jgi:hypothetical protein